MLYNMSYSTLLYIPNVIQIIPYKDLLDDKQNSRGLNGFGSTGVQ